MGWTSATAKGFRVYVERHRKPLEVLIREGAESDSHLRDHTLLRRMARRFRDGWIS